MNSRTDPGRTSAEFMFDDEKAMVRIDMSEFMEKHSVARLIGAPPGYVGYEEGGYLTEAVRRRPYSVLLLDEIEKAHPEVFNILLQILDEGRLTDGHGRTVSFKNAVVIMTSNIGSQWILDPDLTEVEMNHRVMEAMRATFKPEFLNRVDDTVIFHRLSLDHIRTIVEIQLGQLRARLAERDIGLELSEEALDYLAHQGYDPAYGARPLKRLIQKELQDRIALALLRGGHLGRGYRAGGGGGVGVAGGEGSNNCRWVAGRLPVVRVPLKQNVDGFGQGRQLVDRHIPAPVELTSDPWWRAWESSRRSANSTRGPKSFRLAS